MKKNDIELHIASAVESITPDVFSACSAAPVNCEHRECPELTKADKRRLGSPRKKTAMASGVLFAAMLLVFFVYNQWSMQQIVSIVDLDVNPSIELKINTRDQVVKAEALNEDGQKIMDGMDLRKTDIQIASNAILGSMLRQGYLDPRNSALLITVESQLKGKTDELKQKIVSDASQLLNENSYQTLILCQESANEVDEIRSLADKYQISYGKAMLLSDILTGSSGYDEKTLAAMTIAELAGLINSIPGQSLADRTANQNSLIGEEKAGQIALKLTNGGTIKEIELEYEDGNLVYEITITDQGKEFEIVLDAYSGNLLSQSVESDDDMEDGKAGSQQTGSSQNNIRTDSSHRQDNKKVTTPNGKGDSTDGRDPDDAKDYDDGRDFDDVDDEDDGRDFDDVDDEDDGRDFNDVDDHSDDRDLDDTDDGEDDRDLEDAGEDDSEEEEED